MTNTDATRPTTSTRSAVVPIALGLATGLVALVTGALLLRTYGPGNMWAGYIVGASIALVGFGFALWRVWRHPGSTTTAERAVTTIADERDRAVSTRAAAVVGATALPLTGVAAIVIAVGVDPVATIGVLLWVELAVLITAFAVANRRM